MLQLNSGFIFSELNYLELLVCYLVFCIVVTVTSDAVSVQKAEIRPGGRPLPPRLSGAHPKPQRNVLHPSESSHVVSTECDQTVCVYVRLSATRMRLQRCSLR